MKNLLFAGSLLLSCLTATADAETIGAPRVNAVELSKKTAENQIRRIIEPVLDRYCREDCKLLNIAVQIDTRYPEQIAPGFDDVDTAGSTIGPSSAKIKLLINDKVGPVSRGKLIELMEQYLENLDYETEIDTQLAKFPDPVESATKVIELREKISKQFKATLEELFKQFCPKQCLIGDYSLKTETVNTEEAQYGQPDEYIQDGGISLKIKDLSATILMDERLTAEDQDNIIAMARLRTQQFRNVNLAGKSIRFPRPAGDEYADDGYTESDAYGPAGRGISRRLSENHRSDSSTSDSRSATSTHDQKFNQSTDSRHQNSVEENRRQKFEHYERIERVENGDAVQQELKVFKTWGLIFACAILGLLILLAVVSFGGWAGMRKSKQDFAVEIKKSLAGEISQNSRGDYAAPAYPAQAPFAAESQSMESSAGAHWSMQMQIHQLQSELIRVFSEQPKVAKTVFTRVLTEEGIEVTAKYIQIFGETVVLEMLRDPSLHSDLNKLIEYYAHNPVDLKADEKLDLLKRIHNRTVAGKLTVYGNRSSDQFEFIANLDATQISQLLKSESITAKALVLTQIESQKRTELFEGLDEETRARLMGELARIDHLPKAYIAQVSDQLRRKLQSQPQLNTEILPGSDILVDLLERSKPANQRQLIRSMGEDLGSGSESTLRVLKKKMISMDTLSYLDSHVALDVVLGLPHEELVQFLKVCPSETRDAILHKSPPDLRADIIEEMPHAQAPSREVYERIEQKILNRIKVMAKDGAIDLYETNSRMFQSLGLNATGEMRGFRDADVPSNPPSTLKRIAA